MGDEPFEKRIFRYAAAAAVLQFYFLTSAFCLIAVSFTRLEGVWAAVFLLAVAVLTVRMLWNLGALSTEPRQIELGSCSKKGER